MDHRLLDLDLGWDPAGFLNVLLMQPFYRVEEAPQKLGLIRPEHRENQTAVVRSVAAAVASPSRCAPSSYLPIHIAVLPEFAVPAPMLPDLLDSVRRSPKPILLVAGLERLEHQEYRKALKLPEMQSDYAQAELAAVKSSQAPDATWVNAMLIAWRQLDGTVGAALQRKQTASRWEKGSLCQGDALYMLRTNRLSVAFVICSDMLDAPSPSAHSAVHQQIEEWVLSDEPPSTLDALVHIQYNPSPGHGLVSDSYRALLTDSPRRGGSPLRHAMVLAANVAAECEEARAFARCGVLVGANRADRREPPECCLREDGDVVGFTLRPRRASAFLLQTRLPSCTPDPEAPAGNHPLTRCLWIGLRRPPFRLDFHCDPAAVPDAPRFAAWKAFPQALTLAAGTPMLAPRDIRGSGHALFSALLAAYAHLRRLCWGSNGDWLSRWGRGVHLAPAVAGMSPDKWKDTHVEALRRLVAALTVIHACYPLRCTSGSADSSRRAALEFGDSSTLLLPHEASGALWDETVAQIAELAEVHNDPPGTVYVVSGSGARSPQAGRTVRLGGLGTAYGPTRVDDSEVDPLDVTAAHVVVVDSEELDTCARDGKSVDIAGLKARLAGVLAGLVTTERE